MRLQEVEPWPARPEGAGGAEVKRASQLRTTKSACAQRKRQTLSETTSTGQNLWSQEHKKRSWNHLQGPPQREGVASRRLHPKRHWPQSGAGPGSPKSPQNRRGSAQRPRSREKSPRRLQWAATRKVAQEGNKRFRLRLHSKTPGSPASKRGITLLPRKPGDSKGKDVRLSAVVRGWEAVLLTVTDSWLGAQGQGVSSGAFCSRIKVADWQLQSLQNLPETTELDQGAAWWTGAQSNPRTGGLTGERLQAEPAQQDSDLTGRRWLAQSSRPLLAILSLAPRPPGGQTPGCWSLQRRA
ncbi:uncharacterized protein LOC116662834 [Camelus ferus]|uniref:Uncharacterized protein LOC116662834 n=1 Tax=Camelus ferus TaxID=419612 RepID=A0A8B8ST04_CAMFR|nr:uncharacterized protein LOC116662834 [Camelus ferus]